MARENSIVSVRRADAVAASLAYSNSVIPIVAAALTLSSTAILGFVPGVWSVILGMAGSFLVYIFERAWLAAPEDEFNHPDRLDWLGRHRGVMGGVTLLAIAAFCTAVVKITSDQAMAIKAIPIAGMLAFAAATYCLPVLPGGERVKSVWFLKPVLVAAAWSAGTVLLPVALAGHRLGSAAFVLAAYRLLFLLPNTLLADVPDAEGDRRAGLRTVATQIGTRTVDLAAAVAVLIPLAALGLWLLGPFPAVILIDAAVGPFFVVLCLTRRPRERLFYVLQLDLLLALPVMTAVVAGVSG